jgi:glyoxylase-like metal-dependent hydrolase (beta-lactamase superfamily II)
MKIEKLKLQIGDIPGFITNCYIVSRNQDANECLVIDPADKIDEILAAVGTRKVVAIVLTHRHDDHSAATSQLVEVTGADVYAHELDAQAIMNPQGHYPKFVREKRKPPQITGLLRDGELLVQAGLELKVIHTPGHSIGSICLYSPDDKVLFSGDTLFYGTTGRTDLPTGDARQMHESLRLLAKLDDDVIVYPGHDSNTSIGNERYRALVEY